MDKNKVKFVTLEEIKNIEPSLIKFMTFIDGTVAMVDSDKEDEESEEKDNDKNEMNKDNMNQEEKEPDIQNDPNMYLNFESESETNIQNNNKINNNNMNNSNNKKENNINNNYRINQNLYNANKN